MRTTVLARLLIVTCVVLAASVPCRAAEPIEVGVEEQLGERLPLEDLTFIDEDGKPIVLKELFDRPVILTLVYYRCPGICTPLLNELTRAVDNCDLNPGEDYRLVTISFDPEETPDLARNKKANMLAELKKQHVEPDEWHYLTGDEENIRRVTEAVGFRYISDGKADYIHAATVVFLSPDGMIARYLNGLIFNPADLKMAVIDASEHRARSFMQKLQRLCYAYDPEGRSYALQINRIVLGTTFAFAGIFALVLVIRHKSPVRAQAEVPEPGGGPGEDQQTGGQS